jgi:hypothetical protein
MWRTSLQYYFLKLGTSSTLDTLTTLVVSLKELRMEESFFFKPLC